MCQNEMLLHNMLKLLKITGVFNDFGSKFKFLQIF